MSIDNIVEKESNGGVAVENLIVDNTLKKEIIEFYSRKDYYSKTYREDKKKLMKEYRFQCSAHLTEEYEWPKYISDKIAQAIHIPKNKKSTGDYVAAYFAGSLPKRYVEPVAKLMGADRKFYTGFNILTDIIVLGISAYILHQMKPQDTSFMDYVTQFSHETAYNIALKANFLTRIVQIPIRTRYHLKGKHTWSPATLINPNLFETIPMIGLLGYDLTWKYIDWRKKSKTS